MWRAREEKWDTIYPIVVDYINILLSFIAKSYILRSLPNHHHCGKHTTPEVMAPGGQAFNHSSIRCQSSRISRNDLRETSPQDQHQHAGYCRICTPTAPMGDARELR